MALVDDPLSSKIPSTKSYSEIEDITNVNFTLPFLDFLSCNAIF